MTLNTLLHWRHWKKSLAVFAAVATLGGCAWDHDRESVRTAYDLDEPQKALLNDGTDIIGKNQTDPIVHIYVDSEVLVPRPLEKSEPLPDVRVEDFSAVDASILEAFRVLLLDEGVSVSVDPALQDVRVNILDLSGQLKDVLDRVSETSGVYYVYRNGLLVVKPKRTFVVGLPSIPLSPISADSPGPDDATSVVFDEMSEVIQNFGGENVKIDRFSRMLTFTANRKSYEDVSNYLEEVKKSKVMIVYETYVFEVTLEDSNNRGINWSAFDLLINDLGETGSTLATTFTGGATASGNPLTFGATYASNKLDVGTTITFLESQGDLETISKPTIAMISGTSARFEVGESRSYVDRVDITTEGSTQTVTPSTAELSTGFLMRLSGDYVDETVFTRMELEISDLLELNDVTFGSGANITTIQLPRTTTRSLQNQIRARPGDTILIAGINESRDESAVEGVPGFVEGPFPFQSNNSQATERTEIVIVMVPRIIKFVNKPSEDNVIVPQDEETQGFETLSNKKGHLNYDDGLGIGPEDSINPADFLSDVDAPEAEAGKLPASRPQKSSSVVEDPYNRSIGNDPHHNTFQYFRKEDSVN